MARHKRKTAFTLIEVLIVVVLLGLLSFALLFSIKTQVVRARDARRKIHLENIGRKIEEYYDEKKCYPDSLPSCGQPLVLGENKYIADTPCDPKGSPYIYLTDGTICSSWFKIYTNLEDSRDHDIDVVGCRSEGCGPNCEYNYGVSSSNIRVDICYKPTPTPTPVQYVCAPGGGQEGRCEAFVDPGRSQCPKVYPNDPTCKKECGDNENRCKDSSGKYKPY